MRVGLRFRIWARIRRYETDHRLTVPESMEGTDCIHLESLNTNPTPPPNFIKQKNSTFEILKVDLLCGGL